MPKKTGFTFEQHQEWGSRMRSAIAELELLYGELVAEYTQKTNALKVAGKALHALDAWRNEMDKLVYSGNRSRENAELAQCYYGATSSGIREEQQRLHG